jgi:general secretion pathway protein B
MSYILEALKKAQAERQLGNAPTIHAPTTIAVPQAAGGRKPLVIGFAAGAVLVAGALIAWRQQPATTGQAADAGRPATQAAAASRPVAQPSATPAPAPAVVASRPDAALVSAAKPAVQDPPARVALVQDPAGATQSGESTRTRPQPAPQKKAAADVAASAPSPAHAPNVPQPALPAAARKVATRDVAAADAAAVPRPGAPAAAPSPEETMRTLNELPDSIRFNVPKVAFGGYMYSPNPADRLVLVDKALRHEGEEVAPGLVLEKLLPRAAVMNYRGYRYRVPL